MTMHRRGPFGPGGPPPFGCGPFARRGYHHGRLKEALVDAARALLGERGAQGFSLADAAKLAGVSPAAPYRHFRDRDALLAEVARQGFMQFGERLSAARETGGDPRDGFLAMGRAYLAFAREEPGLYEAMFSWCAAPERDGEGMAEGTRAFDILLDGIAAALAGPGSASGEPRRLALEVWALAHGVATLAAARQLGTGIDPEVVLGEGVRALLAGHRALADRG
jgi:AcrR family transcriptional regulator